MKNQIFHSLFLKKFSTVFNNFINMYFNNYKQIILVLPYLTFL